MVDLKIKQSASLGAVFTAAMLLVGWLFQTVFGTAIKSLFAITTYPAAIPSPVSPISATLGQKLISLASGYIPGSFLDVGTIAMIFISSFVAIMLGNLLISTLKLPVAKGRIGRIASIILWGSVPVYLFIVGMAVPSITVIIGVLIYTVAASYVTAFLADLMKVQI